MEWPWLGALPELTLTGWHITQQNGQGLDHSIVQNMAADLDHQPHFGVKLFVKSVQNIQDLLHFQA